VSNGHALRFMRNAEKDLRRLDPPIRTRVLAALDRLQA
jgi:phage-related protein